MPHNDYDWSTQIDDGWTSSMNDDKYISSMSVIIIISNVIFFPQLLGMLMISMIVCNPINK
jgi:hypothetical protein